MGVNIGRLVDYYGDNKWLAPMVEQYMINQDGHFYYIDVEYFRDKTILVWEDKMALEPLVSIEK